MSEIYTYNHEGLLKAINDVKESAPHPDYLNFAVENAEGEVYPMDQIRVVEKLGITLIVFSSSAFSESPDDGDKEDLPEEKVA